MNPATNTIYIANQGNSTVTVVNGASNSTTTLTEPQGSSGPTALGINPITNEIYVANYGSSNVTVIAGATNNQRNVTVGTNPAAVAVNPATNKIYVANSGSNSVSVIDGNNPANPPATINVGTNPIALAVNVATNRIYVANSGSNSVSVIDGNNPANPPATINVGTNPIALAVNVATNRIYVANKGSATSDVGNVTVIDGNSNRATTVSDPNGKNPDAVAINPVTNMIYVANNGSNNVTVINGVTNNITSVRAGVNPTAIAVDAVTNQIYVVNTSTNNAGYSSDITVIDGATNTSTPNAPPGRDMINALAVAVNPVTNNVYVTFTFGQSGYLWMFEGATPSNSSKISDPHALGPSALAVNPVTNKIYVANQDSGNVSVIDGANLSDTLMTINVGINPVGIAVNPATNKVYVVNNNANGTVSVINGASPSSGPATVNVGTNPVAIAINSATNKIYVANSGSNTVSVIDGDSDTVTTTVPVGTTPVAAAVNPATNKIYIANSKSPLYKENLSVIDGDTNKASFINLVFGPTHVAVDPVRNMVYAAPPGINSFVVINGSTGQTWYIPESSLTTLRAMAVDEANGKVYVAANCYSGGFVSSLGVISPPANSQSNPGVRCLGGYTGYVAAAVNPVTSTAYVLAVSAVSIIDGVTNDKAGLLNVQLGSNPQAIAVNPVTGSVYIANKDSNNVTVWNPLTSSVPITVTIAPLESNATSSPAPTFNFTTSNRLTSAPADGVFYQADTWQGPWTAATSQGAGAFSGATPTLQDGFHILYAYATDGEEATSTITGAQSSPLTGSIAAYGFVVAVTQNWPPPNNCTYSLDHTSKTFPSTGGSDTINLTMNLSSCLWSITDVPFWVTITSPLSGTGSTTIQYQVSAYTGVARSGSFSVGGQTFTVQQSQSGCSYLLATNGVSLPATGGSGSVNLTTGASCPWSITGVPSWVTITSPLSGTGGTTIQYRATFNTGAAISATIDIAGQTFTIEEESGGGGVNLKLAGSMPQIASAGGWDTLLTLVNLDLLGTGEARLNFCANDGSNQQLPFTFPQRPALGTILGATFDQLLNGNAMAALDTTGLTSRPATGSAELLTDGSHIDGFAVFTYTPTGQAAAVPLETRNASSYLLSFDNTGQIATGVAIANLATSAANVGVVIRDGFTGAQIGTGSIALPPGGHNSFMLTDGTYGFPGTAGRRGTVEFDTPQGGQISVLGLRANGNALTTLPVLVDAVNAGGTLAHIASGGGWQTTFTLVNTGTTTAVIDMNFFDDGGSPLNLPLNFPELGQTNTWPGVEATVPTGQHMLIVIQASGNTVTGSAQLTVKSGDANAFSIFQYTPTGQEAVVPLQVTNADSYLLAFDNTNGLSTGVAIANASAQAATISAVLRDDTGTEIGTGSISLHANGHTSFMLTDTAKGGWAVTANRRGTVEFVTPAGCQISPLGLRASPTPSGGFAITTIPVMTR